MYTGASQPDLTFDGVDKLNRATNVFIFVKLGFEGDHLVMEKVGIKTSVDDYQLPAYHIPSYVEQPPSI